MQLAKIRRKTQPVKKIFYEIWKIAVDLGGFGARRQGRCGARAVGADARRGREAAGVGRRGRARCGASVGRRGAWRRRGRGARARRAGRGEHCRAQARRGHGERDCGTGTARALGGARRVACGGGARGGGAASKTTHLRRALATNRPKLALSAIRTASRMKAMRFGRLYALPPPNSINRKPNRHRRRPILCILIRFAESQNADRTLMRVGSKGDRIAARTTIRESGGDDTRGRGRCTSPAHEGGGDAGAKHDEAAAQGRNAALKSLERSANQTRIAQTPRRRTQPNRNNSVWRRLKSGFWIRTRIPRCRPILHAIRAISTGLSS